MSFCELLWAVVSFCALLLAVVSCCELLWAVVSCCELKQTIASEVHLHLYEIVIAKVWRLWQIKYAKVGYSVTVLRTPDCTRAQHNISLSLFEYEVWWNPRCCSNNANSLLTVYKMADKLWFVPPLVYLWTKIKDCTVERDSVYTVIWHFIACTTCFGLYGLYCITFDFTCLIMIIKSRNTQHIMYHMAI